VGASETEASDDFEANTMNHGIAFAELVQCTPDKETAFVSD